MVKESDKQTQNKLQAFCKHIKREALIYKASRNFHTIQTPLRTAFHDTQRLLLEVYVSNMRSDFVFFAPLMKK